MPEGCEQPDRGPCCSSFARRRSLSITVVGAASLAVLWVLLLWRAHHEQESSLVGSLRNAWLPLLPLMLSLVAWDVLSSQRQIGTGMQTLKTSMYSHKKV